MYMRNSAIHLFARVPTVRLTESYKTNIVEYIKQPSQSSPKKKWDLILQVIRGLEYLHGRKIVHEDIRGSNVLIKCDGSACLANYSLAQLFSTCDNTPRIGNVDSACWSSPETLSENEMSECYTQASDVYSMAMTILEVFTEARPFNTITDFKVIPFIVNGGRPHLPRCLSEDAVVNDLMNKCWEQDPNNRPSAESMRGIIGGVRSSIP